MTAPARMTPGREAELRSEHRRSRTRNHCVTCGDQWPCEHAELLNALAAERGHAQQVEVSHSSAAVLGYSVARQDYGLRDGAWVITDRFYTDAVLDPALIDDTSLEEGEIHVAVVRVDPDGRIGS